MDEPQGERRWVVEPPAPGVVSFRLAVGEGVVLTAEQETALSEFLRSLESADDEVTGFATSLDKGTGCARLRSCQLTCGPLSCQALVRRPPSTLGAEGNGGWDLLGSFGSAIQ